MMPFYIVIRESTFQSIASCSDELRCPCLRCSVKIVQTGVREVVYNQSYSMDISTAMVLEEGGVILRQLHMPP